MAGTADGGVPFALVDLPFLAGARAHWIEAHFIESAARVDEPSMTGRLLERFPGVHRYSQYEACYPDRPGAGWVHRGSMFYTFAPGPIRTGPARSVVVTVGKSHFSFRRMVERIAAAVPPEIEVVFQTGSTDTSGLGLDSHILIPSEDRSEAMRRADLVIVTNPPVLAGCAVLAWARWASASVVLDSHPCGFGAQGDAVSARLQPLHRWLVRRVNLTMVTAAGFCATVESWGATRSSYTRHRERGL